MAFNLATADEILLALGQRIRVQRLAQGLPQQELALMAGLSLGALRTLERSGGCTLETWVRTVQALGLVEELYPLFTPQQPSIAQMERAQAASQRKRAPRRQLP